MDAYSEAYKTLNTQQKKAVDMIDGPVMVIAGPGTGKTQVLALRIATILTKTDTPPDGVLCLTFTNAGVKAMRERLLRYIGPAATRVRIATFHSFGMQLLEKFYPSLGLPGVPVLLDDATSVALLDELFFAKEWQHLRPRYNPAFYFRDLKSLISILKRDRITPGAFRISVSEDIERLTNDPDNLSSRGETKGQLKKDVQKKIEGLKRSLEVADFYELYEHTKSERNIIDYNDVLELMVRLVEESDDALHYMREQFLYVLVDEHQDSSGVQNEFLSAVWQGQERPNIFVVGDDRQLIYGFGGASLAYFEAFKHAFGTATLLTLTENYRSTQTILDSAEALLQSTLAEGKLTGNTAESHPIRLIAADYPRDEIIAAGLSIKEKATQGLAYDHCAVLVPKNYQVKAATRVLRDMGIPVAALGIYKLFEVPETEFLLSVLRIMNDPYDAISLSHTVLHPLSGVPVLEAHRFLHDADTRKLSLDTLISDTGTVGTWGAKINAWIQEAGKTDVYGIIQIIGNDALLKDAVDDKTVRRRVEIIRTLLHLVLSNIDRGEKITLANFLSFIERLKQYDEDIPLAVFAADRGVKVLTLHGSKGLEFDFVWIAHMDERSLMSTKRQSFVLPSGIEENVENEDEDEAKRKLYVAMTRAKRFCTISYARYSYTGSDQEIARIITALPETLFEKQSFARTEEGIVGGDVKQYVSRTATPTDERENLISLVASQYHECSVSVTLLNNFFECPWKWYFRNLLQLPEPQNDSLHIGNVVHKSIEYALKQKILPKQKELLEHTDGCALIEARYDEVLARRIAAQAKSVISSWIEHYAPNLERPYEIEKSFSYRDPEIPELSIYGKIDVVETLHTGSARVTDWKTGSVKTKADVDRLDEEGRMSGLLRQLVMYSYLLEGSNAVSVSESRLVFLEGNAEVTRTIGREDIARLREDIKDYRQYLENGEWMKRPCCAKNYGESQSCDYCAMAQMYGIISPITKAK
jgi:DNA helicase II / ATP-dependent DNA helicase PcrA